MRKNQIDFQFQRITRTFSLTTFSIIIFLLFSTHLIAQSKVIDVDAFNKVTVSPHIEVVFKEGEKESVSIESIVVPFDKLNINVKNNTLNLYLDGAKITTDTEEVYVNGYKQKKSIYNGTIVRAIITYKKISSLDLRGEERFEFEGKVSTKKLNLKIYGESQVYMNEVDIQNLHVAIYGESYLEIMKGKVENQKLTAYGESNVNTMNVENTDTKLTAYGDGTFQFKVSDNLKITSYGEATINYSGSPHLSKGIVIGETNISKVNY